MDSGASPLAAGSEAAAAIPGERGTSDFCREGPSKKRPAGATHAPRCTDAEARVVQSG